MKPWKIMTTLEKLQELVNSAGCLTPDCGGCPMEKHLHCDDVDCYATLQLVKKILEEEGK